MRASTFLAAVLPVGISALPAPPAAALEERQLINNILCTPYSLIVNNLLVDPALIPFCGRYVKVPTTTVTRAAVAPLTITSAVTVTGPGAVTVISTNTITVPAVPATVTSTITSTLTTFSGTTQATCLTSAYAAPVRANAKRAEELERRQLLGGILGNIVGPAPTQTPAPSTNVVLSAAPGPIAGVSIGISGPSPVAISGVSGSSNVPRPTYIPLSIPDVTVSIICGCAAPTSTITAGGAAANTVTALATTTVNPRAGTVTSVRTVTYTPPAGNPLTVTSTVTTTVAALATAIVSNGNGLPYKKFASNFNAYLKDSGFNANYFKGRSVDWTGTTKTLNYATPFWPSMDVDETLQLDQASAWDASQAALLFQGFFLAPQTGTYTFTVPSSGNDNFAELWVGSPALSWNDQNAAFKAIRGAESSSPDGVFSVTMNKGDATPFSYLWANGGGAGRSAFSILLPDGSQPTDISNLFVQPCNNQVFQG